MNRIVLALIVGLLTIATGSASAHAEDERGGQIGACCWEYSCYDVTEEECLDFDSLYAVWLGEGTSCATDECPPPAGACCDGYNCYSTIETNCEGIFYDSMDCYEGLCDEMGTCCLNGKCYQEFLWSDCEDFGGTYLGYGVDCDKFKVCVLWGACCLNTGGCEMTMDESECIDYNGTYAGDGTSCDDEPAHCAEEVWGACCDSWGDCIELSDWECANSGGSFFQDMSCNDDPCAPPTGACCYGDECSIETEADCPGEYVGDDTSCSDSPCVLDYGACCYMNGTECTELPNSQGEYTCDVFLNGIWMGTNTSCDDINCLAGACCVTDWDQGTAECYDDYTLSQCSAINGSFYGVGTSCSVEGAQCILPIGACCEDEIWCTDSVNMFECEAWGGEFLGDGSTCENSFCDPGEYGACCIGGECYSDYEYYCDKAGGYFVGGACDSCTCTQCGTCCIDESCNEDVGSDECESAGGTFLGNVSCTTEPCAPPTPTGACCVDGQCTIETEEDCSGLYLGDDMPCDNNPCGNDGGDGPFIGIQYDVLGTNLVDDEEETWTVDVYAVLADGCRLDAVAGDVNQSKMVSTTGSFYQNIYGGPTSQDINPSLFSAFPDLEYDSFVTIGLTDQNGNAMSDIGIDWTDFESGGAIESTDGSWYVTPADAQGDSGWFQDQFCEDNNGVRIARLTVRGLDSIVFVEALFQGKDADGVTWQDSDLMAIAYDDCDAPTSSCIGDINLDGTVDVLDLLEVIGNWGPCTSCPADIDGNGVVDVIDLLEVIANWGPCPEEACTEGWICDDGGEALDDFTCGTSGSSCTDAFPSDDTILGGTGIFFDPDGIGLLWRSDQSLTETFICAEPSINSLSLTIDLDNGMDDDDGTAIHTWDVSVHGTSVGQFSVVTGQTQINENFTFPSIPTQGGAYTVTLQATNQVYPGGGSYFMTYEGPGAHSIELGNDSLCHCLELADGSTACLNLYSIACWEYPLCDSDFGCPDGYECFTMSCCPSPICMPICE